MSAAYALLAYLVRPPLDAAGVQQAVTVDMDAHFLLPARGERLQVGTQVLQEGHHIAFC